jgi:hypothetical protein
MCQEINSRTTAQYSFVIDDAGQKVENLFQLVSFHLDIQTRALLVQN